VYQVGELLIKLSDVSAIGPVFKENESFVFILHMRGGQNFHVTFKDEKAASDTRLELAGIIA
jgi:hypothetical protein